MPQPPKELPPCPYHDLKPRGIDEVLDHRQLFTVPDPELRSLQKPIVHWPVTVVLLSGGLGDYAAYIGIGSPTWIAANGTKLGFEEAHGFFSAVTPERYRD